MGLPRLFCLTGCRLLFILIGSSNELLRPGLMAEDFRLEHAQKRTRQRRLLRLLEANPLMNDEELARSLTVSVSTVRLDRALLNVPELRERMREMAEKTAGPLAGMGTGSLFGELIGLEPGQWGLSLFSPASDMADAETGKVGSHYLYTQAATLALASMAKLNDGHPLVESARVRFVRPVLPLERCIARSKVGTNRGGRTVVSVRTRVMDEDVFIGRFILTAVPDTRETVESGREGSCS